MGERKEECDVLDDGRQGADREECAREEEHRGDEEERGIVEGVDGGGERGEAHRDGGEEEPGEERNRDNEDGGGGVDGPEEDHDR